MAITNESRDKLKARLSKAIGHLNAVYKMVDEQKYCIDILNQLKAVQSALDKSAEIMLKDHLNTCVVEAVQNNDSARVMEELWQLLRHSNDAEGPEQSLETNPIKAATKSECCGSYISGLEISCPEISGSEISCPEISCSEISGSEISRS